MKWGEVPNFVETLSVVIPSYNSAQWLETTILALDKALCNSNWRAEIIVVDDGSQDPTIQTLENLKNQVTYPLRVISQENQGRFLARWTGISAARFDYILLLDSRVLMDPNALNFAEQMIASSREETIWNAYVRTDESAALPGLFWDVPTRMFWGSFLRNPKRVQFGPENFDNYPKGTGCLLLKGSWLKAAYINVWPEGNTALISDDTRLLRNLVEDHDIILDPEFSAIYRPRVSLSSFLSHTFTRGTLFVDSYAGTSIQRKLIILAAVVAPFCFVVGALWGFALLEFVTLLTIGLLPALIAISRRASKRAILSYSLLVLPFGAFFWAGLARGVVVHHAHFYPRNWRIH